MSDKSSTVPARSCANAPPIEDLERLLSNAYRVHAEFANTNSHLRTDVVRDIDQAFRDFIHELEATDYAWTHQGVGELWAGFHARFTSLAVQNNALQPSQRALLPSLPSLRYSGPNTPVGSRSSVAHPPLVTPHWGHTMSTASARSSTPPLPPPHGKPIVNTATEFGVPGMTRKCICNCFQQMKLLLLSNPDFYKDCAELDTLQYKLREGIRITEPAALGIYNDEDAKKIFEEVKTSFQELKNVIGGSSNLVPSTNQIRKAEHDSEKEAPPGYIPDADSKLSTVPCDDDVPEFSPHDTIARRATVRHMISGSRPVSRHTRVAEQNKIEERRSQYEAEMHYTTRDSGGDEETLRGAPPNPAIAHLSLARRSMSTEDHRSPYLGSLRDGTFRPPPEHEEPTLEQGNPMPSDKTEDGECQGDGHCDDEDNMGR